jgi:hypothetical protein
MTRFLLLPCILAMLLSQATHAATTDFPKWPLRNGDFSASRGWDRPTDWEPATNSGKFNFVMDPQATFANSPSATVIDCVESGSGYLYQRLTVLKGDYRLSVDVSGTGKVAAHVVVAGKRSKVVDGDGGWQTVQVDAPGLEGEIVVSINSEAMAGARAMFRNAKLDIVRLDTAAVPLEGGGQIGELVLPDDADLPERYACYELQKYVFQMTGKTPGLKGRDPVHKGRRIDLGRAADSRLLNTLANVSNDAYILHSTDNTTTLAGKTSQGTLYAVYDFLDKQGCRWVIPGDIGEIVPKRKSLAKVADRGESPDYDARALMVAAQDFFSTGGWITIHADDYFDWLTRNRLNGIWTAGTKTYDFDAHRGHGWIQMLNHSYNSLVAPHQKHFKDHPEWYPLVDGERMPVCDIGPRFVNQLCVSNEGLRDYTVDLIVKYFKENPTARAYPLNPMDAPSFWCECDDCKALDRPGLEWPADRSKRPTPGIMTDRALNYANAVAERVSQVFPDKFIEMYAYSITLAPPTREKKVHKNVFIKYANLSGGRGTGPLGRSLLDPDVPIWNEWRETLDGWKKAGAMMAWYSYMEWEHPDVSLFWFYNTVDLLKNLHRKYNFRMHVGETTNNVQSSPMHYNIVARALWDVDIDYVAVLRDLCPKFYGPSGQDMLDYHLHMDKVIRESVAWKVKDWKPNEHQDFSLEALDRGREMLEVSAAKVKDDKKLTLRIAFARFGHAQLTYLHLINNKKKTAQGERAARAAFDLANSLWKDHGLMVKLPTTKQLGNFHYPPILDQSRVVQKLPETWVFKKDPKDVGLEQKWFAKKADASWKEISTFKAWTSQSPGRDYHGSAWYQVELKLPAGTKRGDDLVIYFGAVDGYTDVFLDGKKIGEQKKDVGVMWDRSFIIPLPKKLDLRKSHRLAIRVHKENFAAGIWKPVMIMKGDGEKTR